MLLMAGVSCIKACLEHRGRYTSGCYGAEPAGTCSLAYFTHINSLCPQVCVKDHTETKKKIANTEFLSAILLPAVCRTTHNRRRGKEEAFVCLS